MPFQPEENNADNDRWDGGITRLGGVPGMAACVGLGEPIILWDTRNHDGTSLELTDELYPAGDPIVNEGVGLPDPTVWDLDVEVFGTDLRWYATAYKTVDWPNSYATSGTNPPTDWDDLGGPPDQGGFTMMFAVGPWAPSADDPTEYDGYIEVDIYSNEVSPGDLSLGLDGIFYHDGAIGDAPSAAEWGSVVEQYFNGSAYYWSWLPDRPDLDGEYVDLEPAKLITVHWDPATKMSTMWHDTTLQKIAWLDRPSPNPISPRGEDQYIGADYSDVRDTFGDASDVISRLFTFFGIFGPTLGFPGVGTAYYPIRGFALFRGCAPSSEDLTEWQSYWFDTGTPTPPGEVPATAPESVYTPPSVIHQLYGVGNVLYMVTHNEVRRLDETGSVTHTVNMNDVVGPSGSNSFRSVAMLNGSLWALGRGLGFPYFVELDPDDLSVISSTQAIGTSDAAYVSNLGAEGNYLYWARSGDARRVRQWDTVSKTETATRLLASSGWTIGWFAFSDGVITVAPFYNSDTTQRDIYVIDNDASLTNLGSVYDDRRIRTSGYWPNNDGVTIAHGHTSGGGLVDLAEPTSDPLINILDQVYLGASPASATDIHTCYSTDDDILIGATPGGGVSMMQVNLFDRAYTKIDLRWGTVGAAGANAITFTTNFGWAVDPSNDLIRIPKTWITDGPGLKLISTETGFEAIAADSSFVWAHKGSTTLYKVSKSTLDVVDSFTIPASGAAAHPQSIASDDTYVYVLQDTTSTLTIHRFDIAAETWATFSQSLSNPNQGIFLEASGIWAFTINQVARMTAAGSFTVFSHGITTAIVDDMAQIGSEVFVCNNQFAGVFKIDVDTNAVTSDALAAQETTNITAADGDLWVNGAGGFYQYDPDGTLLDDSGGGLLDAQRVFRINGSDSWAAITSARLANVDAAVTAETIEHYFNGKSSIRGGWALSGDQLFLLAGSGGSDEIMRFDLT